MHQPTHPNVLARRKAAAARAAAAQRRVNADRLARVARACTQ